MQPHGAVGIRTLVRILTVPEVASGGSSTNLTSFIPLKIYILKNFFRIKLKLPTMAIKFECVFQDVRLVEEPPDATSRRCWDTDPGSNPDSPGGCVWWLLDQPYIFYSPQFYVQNHMRGAPFFYLQIQIES